MWGVRPEDGVATSPQRTLGARSPLGSERVLFPTAGAPIRLHDLGVAGWAHVTDPEFDPDHRPTIADGELPTTLVARVTHGRKKRVARMFDPIQTQAVDRM